MQRIKHSKFKDSGILLELLTRQITSDLMSSADSKAIGVLKKYFSNTELAKESNLYSILLKTGNLSESKAEMLINTITEQSKKLDRVKLNKEKYNFIREIKKHYDLDNFFKAKIKDYKVSAAIYTVVEAANNKESTDTEQLIKSKNIILEHVTVDPLRNLDSDSDMREFLSEEKEIKILSYKFLIERFNSKYDSLSDEQKEVLKEYINNVTDTVQLKSFLNTKLTEVKTRLKELTPKVSNKVTAIKLNEVIHNINTLSPTQKIKDDHLISLMQYYELIKELREV